tara:strand:+ start:12451 stop:14076 length:1626 start_codon:yes stop_codon:yes gene_type:complete
MLEIVLHYLIFLFIIYANGLLVQKVLINSTEINLNFFEQSIMGLIGTGFIALLINFFLPLNDLLIYLNLFLGIIFIYFSKDKFNFNYNKSSKLFIILFFLLSLASIYGSGFSDDLSHYHGGYITNTDNQKYIIGLNFLHYHYGYSSIWLILHSYLNLNNSFLQDIHILNGIIFFLSIAYLFTENNEKSKYSSNYLLYLISSIFIFFFLIKYTRLKEFGLDRPGILIYCFLIYFAVKYEFIIKKNLKDKEKFFFIILFICLFITSVKIFLLSCFLVPLVFIIKSKSYDFIFSKIICFFYLLALCYFIKNILISGCLVYPFSFTCFSDLAWNSKEIASNLLLLTEASTKSYDGYLGSLNISEYINNFNWLSTWFQRNIEEFNNYILTSLLVTLLFFASSKTKRSKIKFNYITLTILLLFFINIIIFLKSPVNRYHHVMFILFALSLTILSNKSFVKKIFYFKLIIILLVFFNFAKNFKRIYEANFYNNPYEHVKKIGWYRSPVEKKLESFTYFNGWIDGHPIGNMNLNKYNYKRKMGFDIIYK